MRNLIFFVAIFFAGCSMKNDLNYEPIELIDENSTYYIDEKWYKGYKQERLNFLVDEALKNNYDLKLAGLNLQRAYANLGLNQADLFPTFGANWNGDGQRVINSGDNFTKSYSSGINVSYEIDLFGKIRSNIEASNWNTKASYYDLQNTRLTLINSVVSGYFEMLYLNEAINFMRSNLKDYEQIQSIAKAKYDYGRGELIEYKQAQTNIISLQNRILELQRNLEENRLFLQNLIISDVALNDTTSLLKVPFLGASLDMSYEVFANRPDIKAAISNMNAGFYDHERTKLSYLPTISIGGSLTSSNASNVNDSFHLSFLGGNVRINLPFLDYARLKENVKISKIDFEKNKLNYEKTLSQATNELKNLYEIYNIRKNYLKNIERNYNELSQIAEIYRIKYEAGGVELKDYLNAKTAAIDAKISQISQKYATLQAENAIYKATAGRWHKRR